MWNDNCVMKLELLELNQKMFHNMPGRHIIKGILIQQSRKVTKKEDKKCIRLLS